MATKQRALRRQQLTDAEVLWSLLEQWVNHLFRFDFLDGQRGWCNFLARAWLVLWTRLRGEKNGEMSQLAYGGRTHSTAQQRAAMLSI